MKQCVYLETTIVSYVTARPTRDLIRAARQEITRQWWDVRRNDFELHVSQVVVDEIGRGDPEAAESRLALVADIPRLEINEPATELARALLDEGALPRRAVEDALHIALSAVHGMDFLLTWNCSHIANAEMMGAIQSTIRACGYEPPLVCTPEEMLGDWE
jgi:hypothetical protein